MITKFDTYLNEAKTTWMKEYSPEEIFDKETEEYDVIIAALNNNRKDVIDYFTKWYEDKFEPVLLLEEIYEIIVKAYSKKHIKLVETIANVGGMEDIVNQLFRWDKGFDVALYLYNQQLKSIIPLREYISITLGYNSDSNSTDYTFSGSVENMKKLLSMDIQLNGGVLKEMNECERKMYDAFYNEILKIAKKAPERINKLFGLCDKSTIYKIVPKYVLDEIDYLLEFEHYTKTLKN